MSEMKHTPGPWGITVWSPGTITRALSIPQQPMWVHQVVIGGREYTVGSSVGEDKPQPCANAHLIASSPELYDALTEVLAIVKKNNSDEWERNGDGKLIDQARAALAKARGEK